MDIKAFWKESTCRRRAKGKTITVAKSMYGMCPELVGRVAQMVKYLEEVTQDSNVTMI